MMIRHCKHLIRFDKIIKYTYGTNVFKVRKSKMLRKTSMINFDHYANENKIEHNLKWSTIQIIHAGY